MCVCEREGECESVWKRVYVRVSREISHKARSTPNGRPCVWERVSEWKRGSERVIVQKKGGHTCSPTRNAFSSSSFDTRVRKISRFFGVTLISSSVPALMISSKDSSSSPLATLPLAHSSSIPSSAHRARIWATCTPRCPCRETSSARCCVCVCVCVSEGLNARHEHWLPTSAP